LQLTSTCSRMGADGSYRLIFVELEETDTSNSRSLVQEETLVSKS